MYELWDKDARGEQYSIVTKRRLFEKFMDDPTEESLKRFARSLWAFESWATVDFPVEERMLVDEYGPADFRDFIEDVHAGERSTRQPGTPDLGTWVMSEILETMDPDTYATLNNDARTGMDLLGYPTPETPLQDGEEYWEFVENVKAAVDEHDLRYHAGTIVGDLPDDVPAVDVSQFLFQRHSDTDAEFTLSGLATETGRN